MGRDLRIRVDHKEVVRGLDLTIDVGQVVVLMGANGSGKSSLAMAIMGSPVYTIGGVGTSLRRHVSTKLEFEGKSLLNMTVDERARSGLFVAWQNPMTIPGLSVFTLCKASVEVRGEKIASLVEFRQKLEQLAKRVGLTPEHIGRSVNEGFSGGERKRFELLQLLLLKPKLAILDEIDSGLDIDGLKTVAKVVNELKRMGTAFVIITHYKRLLEYVKPDKVLLMKAGKIVREGGEEIVQEIERNGYGSI